MARKKIPLAICYDFDGTLAPGNMQERDFIPAVGMHTHEFWSEVKQEAKANEADEILVYMKLMLEKAEAKRVKVAKNDFEEFGRNLQLYPGVPDWFERINEYGAASGIIVEHFIISSGIKEMILGSKVREHFRKIYASSFIYDHHGVARWPALALNYTTKTQYLFRINKGCLDVYDHGLINVFVPLEQRPIPFSNMIFIGDGETDVPCFRLVKDQGGHSIAVYKPGSSKQKKKSEKFLSEGRVNFSAPADFSEKKKVDQLVKAIMEKISADSHLYSAWPV